MSNVGIFLHMLPSKSSHLIVALKISTKCLESLLMSNVGFFLAFTN